MWWESQAINTCQATNLPPRTINKPSYVQHLHHTNLQELSHQELSHQEPSHQELKLQSTRLHKDRTSLNRLKTDLSSTIPHPSSFQSVVQLPWTALKSNTVQLAVSSQRLQSAWPHNKKCSVYHWPTAASQPQSKLESAVAIQITPIHGLSVVLDNTCLKNSMPLSTVVLTNPSLVVHFPFALRSNKKVITFPSRQTPSNDCTCHQNPTEFKLNLMPFLSSSLWNNF